MNDETKHALLSALDELKYFQAYLCDNPAAYEAVAFFKAEVTRLLEEKHERVRAHDYALREAHRNASEDAYFAPRPVQDGAMSRRSYCDGFDRGWDAALSAEPAPPAPRESSIWSRTVA